MTTYERLIAELGDGLGIPLAPDGEGLVELVAEGRAILIRADETRENELTAFSSVISAPEGGFPPRTLQRALEMNLFGQEVVGHHLGLFAGTLLLSATIPLSGLTAESLADRLLMLSRLTGKLSEELKGCKSEETSLSEAPAAAGGFIRI